MSTIAYRSRAVRALILLHEQHLRRFVDTWTRAKAANVVLPSSSDPAYASVDTLAHHVFRAARGYMVWMCEVLALPDPAIDAAPEPATIAAHAERYLEHVLERWRTPLADVSDHQLDRPEYPSRWQTLYSIDAMLEHAVMHPIRHTFQLEELIAAQRR